MDTTLRGTCDDHPDYVAGCTPCQQRSRTRRRTRYRQAAYGQLTPGHTDTTPARDHIAFLHDQHGMSYRHIAYAAGARRESVTAIAAGTMTRAYPTTVARILTVTPAPTIDTVAIQQAMSGRLPLDRLNRSEQVEVWRMWRRRRAGLPAGPQSFATQFSIGFLHARRIQAAADRSATNRAAGSRTNRKGGLT